MEFEKLDKKLDKNVYELYDFKPQKSDLKKVEIVLATIESLAKLGFDKTSYSSIAKIIDFKKSTVAYYFSSKEMLIKEAVRHCVRCQQQLSIKKVATAKNDKEMIFKYIEATFDWAQKYPEQLAVFVLFRYLATYNEEYKQLHTQIREGGLERIKFLITQKYGKKLTKQDSLHTALKIQCLLADYSIISVNTNLLSTEQAKNEVLKMVKLMLR
ncbi:MAG: TetR family transcriptional regulator [Bacteriovoracaceae bacterium]|nr:TetR family transcriptional regulator [Bacteriovoracaceae bacterium]